MKFAEILEKSGVESDEKARRVLNTSTATASITADEIEAGVTLERLSEVGVPVYRYSTQLTIHGMLPDFSPEARPAGYKAVFRNRNGSIGVRYVAVDAAKKQRLVDAARLAESRGWSAHINSEGLFISHYFEKADDCLAAYKTFPKDLFHGSVTAARGALGGFYVWVFVGAIPAEHLWTLIGRLFGIESEAALAELETARDAEWERKRQEAQKASAQRAAEVATKKAALAEATAATRSRLTRIEAKPGRFARIMDSFSAGIVLRTFVLEKRGPCLCYTIDGANPSQKASKVTPAHLERWNKDCLAGLVFAAA